MSEWRYLVYRLDGYTGTETLLVPEANLSGVTLRHALSAPPGISASVDAWTFAQKAHDGRPLFVDWSTLIFAEKDGEIRAGGMLIDTAWNGETYDLTVAGYMAHPQGQPYVGPGEMHVQIDLADAVRKIWTYLQAIPGGNLGLEVDPTTLSAIRIGTKLEQVDFTTGLGEQVSFEAGPWKLSWHTTDDIGRVMDDLFEQGMEYRETHSWRPDGTIRHRVDLWAPGSPAGGGAALIRRRTDVRIVLEENAVELPTKDRDSENYANTVQGLGAGDGPKTVRSVVSQKDPLGRVARARNVTDSSLRSKGAVTLMAKQKLAESAGGWEITQLRVRDSHLLPIGTLLPGDEVRVIGNIGEEMYDDFVRVVTIEESPENGDEMTLTVVRHDKSEEQQ